MNRSKIEWCDHTFNPVTGCRHGCPYCYARRMTARFSGNIRLNLSARADYRMVDAADGSGPLYCLDRPMKYGNGNPLAYPFGFEPTLHDYRWTRLDGLKTGCRIFVGAMADLFGRWVPEEWIGKTFDECLKRPQHNYLFLTKNPGRYMELSKTIGLPETDHFWYGTTITDPDTLFFWSDRHKTFLSIEPLLKPFPRQGSPESLESVDWIIIGAMTGPDRKSHEPEFEWVRNIVLRADDKGIPVFMKDSLIPIVGEENMRRDYPPELKRRILTDGKSRLLYDTCMTCGAENRKKDMVTMQARKGRHTSAVQYGFMCMDCFEKYCENYGIEMPDFKGGK